MENTNGKIKIVLAEDHILIRQGIARTLRTDPRIDVIAEFGNGKKVIEFLKTNHADIVLLDIEMPVMNGMETLSIISRRFQDVKVIMLTMHSDHSTISDIIHLGANGYLSKSCDDKSLFTSICKVHEQGKYFEQELLQAMLARSLQSSGGRSFFSGLSLSEKETEVLVDLCNEKTMREIAESHHISIDTVRFHLKNLHKKTNTRKAAGLVKYAIKNSIILLD